MRLYLKVWGFFSSSGAPAEGSPGAVGPAGPPAVVSSWLLQMGPCPTSLGRGLCSLPPPRTVLSEDTQSYVWDGPVLSPVASTPQGHARRSCCGCLPCSPAPPPLPHKLSGRVPVSQAPGETGSSPEPQLQKSQTTAPPCLPLLPSAALQFRAAFSLSLRLPRQGD